MTKEQAEHLVSIIQSSLANARQAIVTLYVHEGWKVLGYQSWIACVEDRFKKDKSYLYRELAAGNLEQRLGLPIGGIKESYLRQVLAQTSSLQEEQDAIIEALNDEPSIKNYKIASQVAFMKNNFPILYERVISEKIPKLLALELVEQLRKEENLSTNEQDSLQLCQNVELLQNLLQLRQQRPNLYHEIIVSGCIETESGEQVPLANANERDLRYGVELVRREQAVRHILNDKYQLVLELKNLLLELLDEENYARIEKIIDKLFGS